MSKRVEDILARLEKRLDAAEGTKKKNGEPLQSAFDEGFEAVKAYVDRSFDEYEKRIDDLDERLEALEGKGKKAKR